MSNKFYPFDKRLEHRELGSSAITAEAVIGSINERAAQRTMYLTKVNIEDIKKSSNNESYQVVVECSNDDFSSLEIAAILDLGAAEVRQSNAPDNKIGDEYDIYWCTEINGVKYEKSRIKVFLGGTSPSITVGCWSTICG